MNKRNEIAKKMKLHKPRLLTPEEQKEKTKNWPKGHYKEPTEHEKVNYQKKFGRAYSE